MIARAWGGPLGGLLLAVTAGSLCAWGHTPLPWMIGPLFALAGARLARVDRRTAFFASVLGGATEMSILADRFGARTDLVAVAQSLRIVRIVLVVSVIPFVYTWIGVHGADPYVQGAREFS